MSNTRSNPNDDDPTDKQVYDMASHFKEEHDKLTKEIKSLKSENRELKKVMMMSYTYLRTVDEIINNDLLELPVDLLNIANICSLARSNLSDLVDSLIFGLKEDSEDEED